jgi:hypothetical protein
MFSVVARATACIQSNFLRSLGILLNIVYYSLELAREMIYSYNQMKVEQKIYSLPLALQKFRAIMQVHLML